MFENWAVKLIPFAILVWTIGVAISVLATPQAAIGKYLKNLGQDRRQRLIAHLKLGYDAVVRVFGERGIRKTLLNVLLFYSVFLPPLALLVTPVDDPDKDPGNKRQWMLSVAFMIWLWGNVLCDTVSIVVTRGILRRLLDQLKNSPGKAFAVGSAVGKCVLVYGACFIVTAYSTAVAYVFELKQEDWVARLQKFSPDHVFGIMMEDFKLIDHPLPFPPHLVVAATSFVFIVFLLTTFSASALATRLLGWSLINRIGTRVVAGDTTNAHILSVLAMIGAVCLGALKIL